MNNTRMRRAPIVRAPRAVSATRARSLTLATLLMIGLAACGGGGGDSPAPAPVGGAPSPTPSATPTPTPTPSPTVSPAPSPSPTPTPTPSATPSPTPSPSPTATPSPAALLAGWRTGALATSAGGYTIQRLDLEDGTFVMFYTNATQLDTSLIDGVVQGTHETITAPTNSAPGDARASNASVFSVKGATTPWGPTGVYSTFSTRGALTASTTGDATLPLLGQAKDLRYDARYDAAPSLSAVAGTSRIELTTWGPFISSIVKYTYAGQITTLADGTVSGTVTSTVSSFLGACNFTGNIKPRAIGNVYDVTLRFGAEMGCPYPNEVFVLPSYPTQSPVVPKFLLGFGTRADRSRGLVLVSGLSN